MENYTPSKIHQLWINLSRAMNSVEPGESILERRSQKPWESKDCIIEKAWSELTSPENFDDLVEWSQQDMNPVAKETTQKALEDCKRRKNKRV